MSGLREQTAAAAREHREELNEEGVCICGWTANIEMDYPNHLADVLWRALGLTEERRTKGEHEQRLALWHEHKALAEAAHERDDIPEANYQYGWVDALAAIEFSGRPVVAGEQP